MKMNYLKTGNACGAVNRRFRLSLGMMHNDEFNDIIDSGKELCRITDVEYKGDYTLWLMFNDGVSGTIDLTSLLENKLFEPLQDKKKFIQFGLEHGALVWSDTIDLSPNYLHRKLNPQLDFSA